MLQTSSYYSVVDALLLGHWVYVLDFDQSFQIFFEQAWEKVLQLVASEVLEYRFPVRLFTKISEIWFHVAAQNSKSCWFASSVLTNKSKYLIRSGYGKPVELECVLSISVSDLTLETFGQIDDFDCSVRTSFDTHTATNAEVFRNLAYSWCFTNLNAEFTSFVNRARLLALLCAFFRFTFIRVYDSYS